MFTQKCYIRKHTDEIEERLLDLNVEKASVPVDFDSDNAFTVFLGSESFFGVISDPYNQKPDYGGTIENHLALLGCIDCGTNEDLFLAVAALRDDTDKYQWFVNKDGVFCKCLINRFIHFNANEKLIEPIEDTKDWHKATVEELIEYFKDK